MSPNVTDPFVTSLLARSAASKRTIVFPESTDSRTIAAVERLTREGIVNCVMIDNNVHSVATRIAGVEYVNSASDPRARDVASLLLQNRGERLTRDTALELASTPLYFADGFVALGYAAGCVAGAVHSTADVVRAALWTVGKASGIRTVSSSFYMLVQPFRGEAGEVLTFTDCAVVPEPTPRQIVDIALAASADRRRIVGDEPRVALLSYSTAGSAEGPSVTRVREAREILRAEAPTLLVDGELQADAALIASVADRKAPDSIVAGRANVLVFPSLDAGNLAYKLVQRLGRATAIGPILQGLARPCSDLSRGATADDIVLVSAITALQSL